MNIKKLLILLVVLVPLSSWADVTKDDFLEIVNKAESYGVLPASLISFAKQEIQSLSPQDLAQINAAIDIDPSVTQNVLNEFNNKSSSAQTSPAGDNIIDQARLDVDQVNKNMSDRVKMIDSIEE